MSLRPEAVSGRHSERVGLSHRADDRVAKYSMGMRQRLGVAACLIGDPQLLILDEPMNGLDPAGMQDMREMILSLVAEGRTVVLSSHLLDEVERTCDAVAIVDRGTRHQAGADRRAPRWRIAGGPGRLLRARPGPRPARGDPVRGADRDRSPTGSPSPSRRGRRVT